MVSGSTSGPDANADLQRLFFMQITGDRLDDGQPARAGRPAGVLRAQGHPPAHRHRTRHDRRRRTASSRCSPARRPARSCSPDEDVHPRRRHPGRPPGPRGSARQVRAALHRAPAAGDGRRARPTRADDRRAARRGRGHGRHARGPDGRRVPGRGGDRRGRAQQAARRGVGRLPDAGGGQPDRAGREAGGHRGQPVARSGWSGWTPRPSSGCGPSTRPRYAFSASFLGAMQRKASRTISPISAQSIATSRYTPSQPRCPT